LRGAAVTMTLVPVERSARAWALGWKSSWVTAAATLWRDSAEVAGFPESTLDAVAGEAPASAAASLV